MRASPILLLVLACSCSPAEVPARAAPEAAKPVVEAPPRVNPPPETAARMAGHLRDAVRIKEAVIAGELDDVRAPARRLVEQIAADELPEAWRPHARTATRLAEAALAAGDLDAAAKAAAGLARACGECHTALADGPTFAPPGAPPPSTAQDPKSQMARHQWAADQMYQALVGRTDATWNAAADALADAPLRLEAITADVELPEDVLRLGDRVHELGRRARTTGDWEARATIYGDFLASCAACHRGGC